MRKHKREMSSKVKCIFKSNLEKHLILENFNPISSLKTELELNIIVTKIISDLIVI